MKVTLCDRCEKRIERYGSKVQLEFWATLSQNGHSQRAELDFCTVGCAHLWAQEWETKNQALAAWNFSLNWSKGSLR